jgi:hypothetical protein
MMSVCMCLCVCPLITLDSTDFNETQYDHYAILRIPFITYTRQNVSHSSKFVEFVDRVQSVRFLIYLMTFSICVGYGSVRHELWH